MKEGGRRGRLDVLQSGVISHFPSGRLVSTNSSPITPVAKKRPLTGANCHVVGACRGPQVARNRSPATPTSWRRPNRDLCLTREPLYVDFAWPANSFGRGKSGKLDILLPKRRLPPKRPPDPTHGRAICALPGRFKMSAKGRSHVACCCSQNSLALSQRPKPKATTRE